MKEIAIITGATGGLGREFVKMLNRDNIDEIWAIARNNVKLEALKKEMGNKLHPFAWDLSNREVLNAMKSYLSEEKPLIKYLINNAGTGRMGRFDEFSMEEIEVTLDINCMSIAVLCSICIPYMAKGSQILNISSQASFQPNPYLTLYGASKAFVTSYSRGLGKELKDMGITVTAVCPGWVNTDLLKKEWNGRKVKYPGIVEPQPVVRKALRDAYHGKDMSVYGTYDKTWQVLSKLLPHQWIMKLWIRGLLYIQN